MQNFVEEDPKTHGGIKLNQPAKSLFEKFGL